MTDVKPTNLTPEPSDSFSGISPEVLRKFKAISTDSVFRSINIEQITGEISEKLVENATRYSNILESLGNFKFDLSSINVDDSKHNSYSNEFDSVDIYYASTEIQINSFDDFHIQLEKLNRANPNLNLLWRGQQNASWGLHSSLFRKLMKDNGVHSPSERRRKTEPYPSEDQMILAEKAILQTAREEWRLGQLNALEIFSRIQHFGASTRLIDVTKNPLIAAWFAVEANEDYDQKDGRLFAIATLPVQSSSDKVDVNSVSEIKGQIPNDFEPFWHELESNSDRAEAEWGTGRVRRYWIPPLHESRFLAQNSGFVLDGVPIASKVAAPYFKQAGESSKYWKKADLLAAGSMYTKTYRPEVKVRVNKKFNFPPTFTFRIKAEAKASIRKMLTNRYGYSTSSIYPDIEGLAKYLSRS